MKASTTVTFGTNVDNATGKYRVDLVLFEIDEFGNSYDEELLLPACFFEVQAKDDIVWNSSNWGHIRFPEATVERIK